MTRSSRFALFVRGALLALLLVAAAVTTSSRANAQSSEPRIFGIGASIGGGVQFASVVGVGGTNSNTGALPDANLGALELRYFVLPFLSVDATIPLNNMILVGALAHVFYWETDFYATFHVGAPTFKFVGGAGLGFDALAAHTSDCDGAQGSCSSASVAAGGLRIPGQVGFEALSAGRHFGFSLLARPFFEIVPAGGVGVIGGGALLSLNFMGYVTR
jgi:hypothetical protein